MFTLPNHRFSEPSSPATVLSSDTALSGTYQFYLDSVNDLNSTTGSEQGSQHTKHPKQQEQEQPQYQTRRSRRPSLAHLLPVLPNPFDRMRHPALRSPFSARSAATPIINDTATVASSPAGPQTATRFSAMASNPFNAVRSSFFTRHADPPSVLDEGGISPIDVSADADDRGETTHREWPSTAGRRSRRQQRQRRRRTKRKRSTAASRTCVPIMFPAMQSRRVRVKMLHALISASVLIMLMITYFALQGSNASLDTFQIFFVILFILLAIIISHCLLRLYLLIRRWNIRQRLRGDQENVFAPRDRAIPVILARDEEIGISGNTVEEDFEKESVGSVAPPPPAYGLWRGSVRADPNLLHWQRVNYETQPPTPEIPPEHVPRPPGYTPPVGHVPSVHGGFF